MRKRLVFASVLVVLSLTGFGVVQSRTTDGVIEAAEGSKEASSTTASPEGSQDKPAAAVRVENVTPQLLAKTAALTGAVTPTHTARLASPGEGPVEACFGDDCMVREGDRVDKGQGLMQIRHKTAEAQLAAAAQALKEEEAELQRITQLVQGGAIPGAQLDSARSKYENARAQLAKAEEVEGDYLIKAPWSGVVSKVFVAEGDYVAPRTPLIEIFDPASLVVQFAVPESQCTAVKKGMPVQVQLDAHGGKSFEGAISRVYPQLDERTRTLTVEATLTEPVDLIPGMFARIQVTMTRIPDALTVPAYSLVAAPDGGSAVFVVEKSKAVRRELTTGLEVDGRVQILSGLRAGDRVIVAGQEKLKEGAAVKVESVEGGSSSSMQKSGGTRS